MLVAARGLDQPQHLAEHRSLAPRTAGVHREFAEGHGDGRLDAGAELGQVRHAQQAAVLLVIGDDRAADVAGVEGRARRLQAGLATLASRRPLLVDHVLQAVAKVALHEHLADPGRAAVRQIDGPVRRPLLVSPAVRGNGLAKQRVRGKALLGETHRGRGHLAEAHRAPPLQRLDPSVGCRRHDRAQEAARDLAAVTLHEIVGRHELRPNAQPAHGEDLPAFSVIENDGRYTRHIDDVALQHAERDTGGHAGVDGVAARLQHRKSRVRRQVVARRDDVPASRDHRPVGGNPARLLGLHGCLAHRPTLIVPARGQMARTQATHAKPSDSRRQACFISASTATLAQSSGTAKSRIRCSQVTWE